MTHIGIDPGVNTGIAIASEGTYIEIFTTDILEAMDIILKYRSAGPLHITIEDPTQWKDPAYLRGISTTVNGAEVAKSKLRKQGAGSVKRDFSIWLTFFKRYNIYYTTKSPKIVGKTFKEADKFIQATGWHGRTNIHGRDAAKLIYQYTKVHKK